MSLSLEILERLIAFDTVSQQSNLSLINYAQTFLEARGFQVDRFEDPVEQKAGILARLGPGVEGGLLLSAHSDVVPVEGQTWSRLPFKLSREGDLLFGRGTTDMKGFLAEMLACADAVHDKPMKAPLTLLISYDEEIGCVGIARMTEWLRPRIGKPQLAIVGEPTEMQVAIGHKGKRSYRADISGQAGHSALAPKFVSALHVAVDFVSALRSFQEELRQAHLRKGSDDLAYSTVHVGRMESGRALNIVPDHAEVLFEFRHLASDDPDVLARRISDIALQTSEIHGGKAQISLTALAAYPALSLAPTHPAVSLAQSLSGGAICLVDFGTEAGFLAALGVPTVVCGPGSMSEQGHKPDEYLSQQQLAECARMLEAGAKELLLGT